jgi:hypothetical protein
MVTLASLKNRLAIFVTYVAGFGICLGSYALLVGFRGNRGSNLGWAVVSLLCVLNLPAMQAAPRRDRHSACDA